jgi:hypothetical protein
MTRIVYNRIAKAGSTALSSIILLLSKKNNFTVVMDNNYFPSNATLYDRLVSLPPNSVYINHCNFVENLPSDFEWINVVREPVERDASFYYYTVSDVRGTNAEKALRERKSDPCGCAYEEYDECVRYREENKQCNNELQFRQPQENYFTKSTNGNSERHHINEELVWKTITQKYMFVGINEEFKLTLQVLETLLPHFFAGAYEESLNFDHHENQTPTYNVLTNTTRTGAISNLARSILERHNPAEVKLYHNLKRLFWYKVSKLIPFAEFK